MNQKNKIKNIVALVRSKISLEKELSDMPKLKIQLQKLTKKYDGK